LKIKLKSGQKLTVGHINHNLQHCFIYFRHIHQSAERDYDLKA